MAKTLPRDKRAVFNHLAPILDSSTVTRSMALLSLEVRRETNSRSSREREAVLPLHDINTSNYAGSGQQLCHNVIIPALKEKGLTCSLCISAEMTLGIMHKIQKSADDDESTLASKLAGISHPKSETLGTSGPHRMYLGPTKNVCS